jgi:hypothetical protein
MNNKKIQGYNTEKILTIFVIGFLIFSGIGVVASQKFIQDSNIDSATNDGTEYWALLVGCNEFLNKPNLGLPGNDISAKDLRDLLLVSEHWEADHIKVLTGKNATWLNIIKGLFWLDSMDDEDDICLFYISTHGMPGFGIDVWPKDEEDGDEMLMTYDTYRTRIGNWFINFPIRTHWITDDMLNNAIDRMDAKGVCAIINACYCEYADVSDFNFFGLNKANMRSDHDKISALDLMEEFSEDLRATNRVILMACSFDELSLGNVFSYSLMEGLQGFCDINNNSYCSAEEAFDYSVPRAQTFLNREFNFQQTPQIYDDYLGELELTIKELPPTLPEINGPIEGNCNIDCIFNISSIDPEEDDIRYKLNWGDDSEELTNFYPSGEDISIAHSWNSEGTFNIWFENEDEHGANFHEFTFPDKVAITISDEIPVDQYQTNSYLEQCFNDEFLTNSIWLAQSFIPSKSTLSKVDLETFISLVNSNEIGQIHISIRSNLTEEDLTDVSKMPQQIDCHIIPLIPKTIWTTYDFPDISVIPGQEYYIVCRFNTDSIGSWLYAGMHYSHDPDYNGDPYKDGTAYYSMDKGITWYECSRVHDFCFVTYG